jgi:hypothetical protein
MCTNDSKAPASLAGQLILNLVAEAFSANVAAPDHSPLTPELVAD